VHLGKEMLKTPQGLQGSRVLKSSFHERVRARVVFSNQNAYVSVVFRILQGLPKSTLNLVQTEKYSWIWNGCSNQQY